MWGRGESHGTLRDSERREIQCIHQLETVHASRDSSDCPICMLLPKGELACSLVSGVFGGRSEFVCLTQLWSTTA